MPSCIKPAWNRKDVITSPGEMGHGKRRSGGEAAGVSFPCANLFKARRTVTPFSSRKAFKSSLSLPVPVLHTLACSPSFSLLFHFCSHRSLKFKWAPLAWQWKGITFPEGTSNENTSLIIDSCKNNNNDNQKNNNSLCLMPSVSYLLSLGLCMWPQRWQSAVLGFPPEYWWFTRLIEQYVLRSWLKTELSLMWRRVHLCLYITLNLLLSPSLSSTFLLFPFSLLSSPSFSLSLQAFLSPVFTVAG